MLWSPSLTCSTCLPRGWAETERSSWTVATWAFSLVCSFGLFARWHVNKNKINSLELDSLTIRQKLHTDAFFHCVCHNRYFICGSVDAATRCSSEMFWAAPTMPPYPPTWSVKSDSYLYPKMFIVRNEYVRIMFDMWLNEWLIGCITPHISPGNKSQICFSVKECCVAPGNSSCTATQICWCGRLTDRVQLPRKLRHDANAQSKRPQSALLSAACRGFILPSKLSVRLQAAYTDSQCLEKNKRQDSVVDVVRLNRRITFPSWRRRCRRGCERLSTGCRTTERSAPRYTWSSKHIWIHIQLSLNALRVSCDQLPSSDAGGLTQRGCLFVFVFFFHVSSTCFDTLFLLLWKHFCLCVRCQATFYLFILLNS